MAVERRVEIYNLVCDLQAAELDSAAAKAAMRNRFPDITDDELLAAFKTFMLISDLMRQSAETTGRLLAPEAEVAANRIFEAYRRGDEITH
jgi:hypothetical protein